MLHGGNLKIKEGFGFGGYFSDILPIESATKNPSLDHLSVDEYWMTEALRESLHSVGISNPNPAVGCVIVKDGVEIARGHTQAYGGVHAERMAFSKVKDQRFLQGATVYVTLEPCSHFGHQPPCADLIAGSGIRRVVVGRVDPDPRVSGRGIKKLHGSDKVVSRGLLEAEITAWNYPFFLTRANQTPIVALKWAQTLDGQLADDWGTSKWISGSSSRAYTHWLRQKYDLILVGIGTFLSDRPRLDVRDCRFIQRQPARVVFDPKGKIFEIAENDLKTKDGLNRSLHILIDGNILSQQSSDHWLKQNDQVHFHVLPNVHSQEIVPGILKTLTEASDVILKKPLQSIFVEGGPKLLSAFLKEAVADVIHVFIAPRMTAGRMNRIQLTLPLNVSQNYDVISATQLQNDMLIEMTPHSQWSQVVGL